MDGTFSPAQVDVSASITNTPKTFASGTFLFAGTHGPVGNATGDPDEIKIGDVDFTFVSQSKGLQNTVKQIFVPNAGGSEYLSSLVHMVWEVSDLLKVLHMPLVVHQYII